MKKSISIFLAIIMLFSVVSVGTLAASITTPKATASNDVGGIKVYWNKVDNAVKYNVYRRAGGTNSWILAGTTTDTKIIDTSVSNGTYYAYSVRAYDVKGSYSAYNSKMTYTTKCVATPKLTSLVNDTNGLKLTWGAVSGASYRVYRRGAGSTSWTYLGTTNSTTFTDSKATSGKYWRYTVRAVSSGYYSGFDTNGLYTIRLANPYSIKASQAQGGVSVTWAKINGATGYRVYRRGAGQTSWSYIGATTGNTFKDTKVTAGQYYRYTVRATRGNVYSGFNTNGSVVLYGTPITEYLPLEMHMRYGVGVAYTSITLNADGTFSGEYRATTREVGQGYVGSTKCCTFTGKFKDIKQVSTNEYTMKLDYIKTNKPAGQVWIENNHRYVSTEAHGFENGDVFTFYTANTPKSSVPSDAMGWYNNIHKNSNNTLGCCMLYNPNGGFAFVSGL